MRCFILRSLSVVYLVLIPARVAVSGDLLPGWPVTVDDSGYTSGPPPTVADLDGDGTIEVLAGTWGNGVVAYRFDGTSLPGWPFVPNEGVGANAIAVGDIDQDGSPESVEKIYPVDEGVHAFVVVRVTRLVTGRFNIKNGSH